MKGIKVKRQPVPQYISGKPQFEKNPKEVLSGMVQGKKAYSTEERLARALEHANLPYAFSVILGAPPNMPGFIQADFVVESRGQIREIEADSAFTHRNKIIKDKLHDARAIEELRKIYGDAVYPKVSRALDTPDLIDQVTADRWVRNNIA